MSVGQLRQDLLDLGRRFRRLELMALACSRVCRRHFCGLEAENTFAVERRAKAVPVAALEPAQRTLVLLGEAEDVASATDIDVECGAADEVVDTFGCGILV